MRSGHTAGLIELGGSRRRSFGPNSRFWRRGVFYARRRRVPTTRACGIGNGHTSGGETMPWSGPWPVDSSNEARSFVVFHTGNLPGSKFTKSYRELNGSYLNESYWELNWLRELIENLPRTYRELTNIASQKDLTGFCGFRANS